MSHRSLEDLLGAVGEPGRAAAQLAGRPERLSRACRPSTRTGATSRSAWQTTCVLFNQSYHMADLAVSTARTPLKLLSQLAVNSFEGFTVDKAKHFVPCTPEGYVIGDVILFHLAENQFNLVGRAPALNWVTYHAETGGYDVEVELDQRSALRTDGRRRSYRFQVQGPNAMDVIEKVLGGQAPELKFFNMTAVTIAERPVRALRHGMVGQPGLGALRPVGGRGAGARGVAGGGRGVRDAPGRRAGLFVEHARVRAGSRRRFPPCTRARACASTASGCRPPGTRGRRRSAGASTRIRSSTTTSPPGISATAATSSSTTTSSAARRSSRSPTTSTGRR